MEKIECKSCSAIVDKSIEFCSSCGDWLGLSLQDMKKENSKNGMPEKDIICKKCVISNKRPSS